MMVKIYVPDKENALTPQGSGFVRMGWWAGIG
jgi:hypothetical protein